MKKTIILSLVFAMMLSVCGIGAFATETNVPTTDEGTDILLRTEIMNLDEAAECSAEGQDICLMTIEEPLDQVEGTEESFLSVAGSFGGISPLSVDKPINNVTLNDGNGHQEEDFAVTSAMPYYKVWIDNTSYDEYNVVITRKTTAGTVVADYSVPARTRLTKYFQADTSFGISKTRWISISSSNSYALSGTLAVKIASTYNELG